MATAQLHRVTPLGRNDRDWLRRHSPGTDGGKQSRNSSSRLRQVLKKQMEGGRDKLVGPLRTKNGRVERRGGVRHPGGWCRIELGDPVDPHIAAHSRVAPYPVERDRDRLDNRGEEVSNPFDKGGVGSRLLTRGDGIRGEEAISENVDTGGERIDRDAAVPDKAEANPDRSELSEIVSTVAQKQAEIKHQAGRHIEDRDPRARGARIRRGGSVDVAEKRARGSSLNDRVMRNNRIVYVVERDLLGPNAG